MKPKARDSIFEIGVLFPIVHTTTFMVRQFAESGKREVLDALEWNVDAEMLEMPVMTRSNCVKPCTEHYPAIDSRESELIRAIEHLRCFFMHDRADAK